MTGIRHQIALKSTETQSELGHDWVSF